MRLFLGNRSVSAFCAFSYQMDLSIFVTPLRGIACYGEKVEIF
jgi:hypothetical protein